MRPDRVRQPRDDRRVGLRRGGARRRRREWSPYWWTRAVEYLHKAHEEAAYAHFQAANQFGRLSEDAADKAREEACGAPRIRGRGKEMGPVDGGATAPAHRASRASAKSGLAPTEDTP